MTAWMRARVSSCTSGDWLMTRDTVFFDTPARRAMSLMVALRPGLIAAGLAGSGAFGVARTALFFLRFMARGLYETCRRHGQGCPAMSRRIAVYATGVIGVATQRSTPSPVNNASAACPAPIEWTPVTAPVDISVPARIGCP